MTHTLRRGGEGQGAGAEGAGGGLACVLDVQSLFFLLKKTKFAPRPGIMLIIYYWQEIFLLTLT